MDTKKTIMVVDDNPDIITIVKTILEGRGYTVFSASSGPELLTMLPNHKADLIILDIMMPEMDGLATMREIRKRPVGRTLPIIAVTAKAMKGDRERCIEAGAWDYLSKPVNREDLLAVLHAWLHR